MNINMQLIDNPQKEGLMLCQYHGLYHPQLNGDGSPGCPYCHGLEQFNWMCPRCGALHSSSLEHCPCENNMVK